MTPILRLVVVQCYRSRVGRSTFPFTARDFRTSRLGKEGVKVVIPTEVNDNLFVFLRHALV
ncbi:unnamed protein product [Arabidopsis lyrata]|nr:unnamed protein product [Arabidopsis lyrata]